MLVLAGFELFWRARGFAPSVTNDAELWAVERGRVARAGPDAVILVGSSRMQLGIDPEALSRAMGSGRPLQLAIAQGPSIPILADLAADPRVTGTIVCEIHPMVYFDSIHQLAAVAAGHLRTRARFTLADEVERRLRTFSQQVLVASLPDLSPARILRAIERGAWPVPAAVRLDADRFGRSDSSRMDLSDGYRAQMRTQWLGWKGVPASPMEVAYSTAIVNRMVADVRARGGDVMFVRMPVDGDVREREERIVPRVKYWDRFAAGVDAVAIHYADHPELAHFELPDGSHLDQRDIADFSTALGEVLVRERAKRSAAGGSR